MGNDQSRGKNEDTIDRFVATRVVQNRVIERALRLVERPRFLPHSAHVSAPIRLYPPRYSDEEFREGPLHVSSMEMYAQVLDYLRVRRGMTVLNVGTGSGFFSTVLGILLGDFGTNHGVEIYPNLIEYANNNVIRWMLRKASITVGFAKPVFRLADILDPEFWRAYAGAYDRIYVSFVITDRNAFSRILRMLRIGGILVAPSQEQMCRYTRISEDEVVCEFMGRVNFARQVTIPAEDRPPVPHFDRLPTVVVLCRQSYRHEIRRRTYPSRLVRRANLLTYRIPIGGLPPLTSSTSSTNPQAQNLDQVMQNYLHPPGMDIETALIESIRRNEEIADARIRARMLSDLQAVREAVRPPQLAQPAIRELNLNEINQRTLRDLMRRLSVIVTQTQRVIPVTTPINHRENPPTVETVSNFMNHLDAWEAELGILAPATNLTNGVVDYQAIGGIRRRVLGIGDALRQTARREARELARRERMMEDELGMDPLPGRRSDAHRNAVAPPIRRQPIRSQWDESDEDYPDDGATTLTDEFFGIVKNEGEGSSSAPKTSPTKTEKKPTKLSYHINYDPDDPDATTLDLFDEIEFEDEEEESSGSAPKKKTKKKSNKKKKDPCSTLDMFDEEADQEDEEEEEESSPAPATSSKSSKKTEKNKKKKLAKARKKKAQRDAEAKAREGLDYVRSRALDSDAAWKKLKEEREARLGASRPAPSVMKKVTKASQASTSPQRPTPPTVTVPTPSSAPQKPSVMTKRVNGAAEPSSSAPNPRRVPITTTSLFLQEVQARLERGELMAAEAEAIREEATRQIVPPSPPTPPERAIGWSPTSSEDEGSEPATNPVLDQALEDVRRETEAHLAARNAQYWPLSIAAPPRAAAAAAAARRISRSSSTDSEADDSDPWRRVPRNRRWEVEMEVERVPDAEEEDRSAEMRAMLENARPGRIGLPPVQPVVQPVEDEESSDDDDEDGLDDEPMDDDVIDDGLEDADEEVGALTGVLAPGTPDPLTSEAEPTTSTAAASTNIATQTEHSPPSPLPPFDNFPGPSMTEQPAPQVHRPLESAPLVTPETRYPLLPGERSFLHATQMAAPMRYLNINPMRDVWNREAEQDARRRAAQERLRVQRERNDLLRLSLQRRSNSLSTTEAIAQQRRLLELANDPRANPRELERERQIFFEWRRNFQTERISLRTFRQRENLNEEDSRINQECDRRFPDPQNADPRIRAWEQTFLTPVQINEPRTVLGARVIETTPVAFQPPPPVDEEVHMFVYFEENVPHSDVDEALTGDSGGSGTEYEEVAEDPNAPGPSDRQPILRRIVDGRRSKKMMKYGGPLRRFSEKLVDDIAGEKDAQPTAQDRRRFNEIRRRQKESETADLLLSLEARNEAIVRSHQEYLARIDALNVPLEVKTFIKNMDERVYLEKSKENQ